MNADSQEPKSVHKTIRDTPAPMPTAIPTPQLLSATMRIPVEQIFDDIEVHRTCCLEIRMPNCPEPISHPLQNSELTLGRHEDADILIPLNSISRIHSRIFPHNEEFIIEDLNSTNGTYVNGVRVSRCVLRHNDLIRIGDATILFSQQKMGGQA